MMKVYSNADRISTAIDGREIHFEKGTAEVSAKEAAVLLDLNSPGNDLFSLEPYRTAEEPKAEEEAGGEGEKEPVGGGEPEKKEEKPQTPTKKTAARKKASRKKTTRSRR